MFTKSLMKWAAIAAVPAIALTVLPVTGLARTTHYAAMSVTPTVVRPSTKTSSHKKAKTLTATHKTKKPLVASKKAHHSLTKSKHTATKLTKTHKVTM
jgi:hypothetical protein